MFLANFSFCQNDPVSIRNKNYVIGQSFRTTKYSTNENPPSQTKIARTSKNFKNKRHVMTERQRQDFHELQMNRNSVRNVLCFG